MLVHLNTPTLYNVLALVAYALNILFHVIAYGTNDWCHFTLHGRRVKLGLWQGCIHDQSRDSWDCSDSVFGEDIFISGKRLWSGKRKYGKASLNDKPNKTSVIHLFKFYINVQLLVYQHCYIHF